VPKTLLAVDDSATMRKVLEITFTGEDFNVVLAESSQSALGKLGEKPAAVVIDTALGGDDGYALAKEIRKKDPAVAILLLASRYAPYDAAKGKDSGADDFMDKPFDTQQIIDKVRKVLLSKEGAPAAAAAPAAKPAAAAAQPAAAAAPKAAPARSQTLVFGENPPTPAPAAAAAPKAAPVNAPPPSSNEPRREVATPANAGGNAAPSAVASAVNGQLAGKLSDLGLSPSQADAVLALSREVVERVVWEVVPQLAEALIKEEILRLTKA
jgi:CheY-like chemotaxis protein